MAAMNAMLHVEMIMQIPEPWNDGAAGCIDRPRAGRNRHHTTAPHCDDAAIFHDEVSFLDHLVTLHGDQACVPERDRTGREVTRNGHVDHCRGWTIAVSFGFGTSDVVPIESAPE